MQKLQTKLHYLEGERLQRSALMLTCGPPSNYAEVILEGSRGCAAQRGAAPCACLGTRHGEAAAPEPLPSTCESRDPDRAPGAHSPRNLGPFGAKDEHNSQPWKGQEWSTEEKLFRRSRPRKSTTPSAEETLRVSQTPKAKVSQPDMPHNAVSGGGYSVLPTDERDSHLVSPRQQ